MIKYFGHKEFSDITAFGKPLVAIYAGVGGATKLIWERVKSCYGRGIWIQEKPWLDNDTWKDN